MADASDTDDPTTPGYKVAAKVDMKTIAEMDADDESLVKYKQALLGNVDDALCPADDDRRVVIQEMRVMFEDRPGGDIIYNLDNEDKVKAMKSQPFTLKEGCNYKIKVTFKVQHEIVSGLKYVNTVYRKGVKVARDDEMLGSFGPQKAHHEVIFPRHGWEEAPSGMLSRGKYTAISRFVDDDKAKHLEVSQFFWRKFCHCFKFLGVANAIYRKKNVNRILFLLYGHAPFVDNACRYLCFQILTWQHFSTNTLSLSRRAGSRPYPLTVQLFHLSVDIPPLTSREISAWCYHSWNTFFVFHCILLLARTRVITSKYVSETILIVSSSLTVTSEDMARTDWAWFRRVSLVWTKTSQYFSYKVHCHMQTLRPCMHHSYIRLDYARPDLVSQYCERCLVRTRRRLSRARALVVMRLSPSSSVCASTCPNRNTEGKDGWTDLKTTNQEYQERGWVNMEINDIHGNDK